MFICRIKQLRKQRGWTQKELAIKSNLSQPSISDIESNSKSTTLNTLEKIAEALNCCVYTTFNFECKKYKSCELRSKSVLNCFDKDVEYHI